jgi:hypothetical protein
VAIIAGTIAIKIVVNSFLEKNGISHPLFDEVGLNLKNYFYVFFRNKKRIIFLL